MNEGAARLQENGTADVEETHVVDAMEIKQRTELWLWQFKFLQTGYLGSRSSPSTPERHIRQYNDIFDSKL